MYTIPKKVSNALHSRYSGAAPWFQPVCEGWEGPGGAARGTGGCGLWGLACCHSHTPQSPSHTQALTTYATITNSLLKRFLFFIAMCITSSSYMCLFFPHVFPQISKVYPFESAFEKFRPKCEKKGHMTASFSRFWKMRNIILAQWFFFPIPVVNYTYIRASVRKHLLIHTSALYKFIISFWNDWIAKLGMLWVRKLVY